MPSSTSSFNVRIPPDIRYGWLWFLTGILFVLMIMLSEGLYRWQGHLPNVVDSKRLWAFHRADVYSSAWEKRIVIAGSSRAQLGLVPSVMENSFPQYAVKQLTISGTPAFEVVRDLCEDPDFDGLIIWSATASALYPPEPYTNRDDHIYVQFYHDEFRRGISIDKNLECWLGAYLQSHLVTLSPYLTLKAISEASYRPTPIYISMNFNRYKSARYYSVMTKSERDEHRRKRIERRSAAHRVLDMGQFNESIKNDLTPLYRLLRSRGGELVLLRMPTTGEHWSMDNDSARKEFFWDQITELTDIPTIHFRDYPELMAFDCPDTSHLDTTDAPEFTRRLSRILKRKLEGGKLHPLGR